tara:strand:+ start:660 stop:1040 length:381 start_codon:yes stop_codon:yes gene_type:complete
MKNFSRFILIQTTIIFFIVLFPVLSWGRLYLYEIFSAFSISIANVFLGYFLVINSFEKKTSEFYKTVYGGMLLRMLFIFSFSIFMINNGYLSSAPYMLSLIIFYIIHQWTEISFWIKDLKGKTIEI